MLNLIFIFLLGMIGTFFRLKATQLGLKYLLLANLFGLLIGFICIQYNLNIVVAGFSGSLTSLSALMVAGEKNHKYLITTIVLSYLLILSLNMTLTYF